MLECVWERGFRKVIIESDNLEAIRILNGNSCALAGHGLVSTILNYMSRACTVVFQHVGRNGNRIADWLAAFNRDDRSGLFQFHEALIEVLNLLQQDVMGV
ncbi:hypothetical protein V6N13_038060 [Hibiscus sabdariffa]|uniref:RNase H type-1 domain-containing protein n=1 Tax=Hibiscus sabdariffa TaxID=183260 RepID=A0ABR2S3G9_9ROSI